MSYTSRSIRFEDDPEGVIFTRSKENVSKKHKNKIHHVGVLPEANLNKVEKQVEMTMTSSSLKAKVLSRVFSEDYERVKNKILDPQGETLRRWNKIFLVSCLVSLFIDPLFFYLPEAGKDMCMAIGIPLEVTLMVIRSVADMFYVIQIYVRFRTAFVAPSSRVFGRGELVIDASRIASRYLEKDFWIDLVAAIPLPQMLIWVVIPFLDGSPTTNTKNVLRFTIMIQYLPRLFLIFPLSSKIVNTTGVVTETAWAGAAYNLMLYMLASHVLGACWYLLSIERQEACLRKACKLERSTCRHGFLDCHNDAGDSRKTWFASSNITKLCDPDNNDFFKFGIYRDALTFDVTSTSFFNKYFYCFWWGLRNLSSLGTNLSTSTFVGEISFAIVIAIVGLVLFARLIGNMQTYLQSTTVRLEEWRIKRTDTEQWMRHRQLPQELKDNVRRYDHYKWLATRGVDEERLLKDLPLDLRRDIKRHLCLDLVRRVPLFDQMDEQMLDAICERLKPALCTQGTCLVREGDPVNEMLFIIRGHLDSYTTNGGRTGFFNLSCIGPGDFCGEELLTWALDPRPNVILPSSTRTVKAISEVEAFALIAEDMKFVAGQFRRLHSKQLRHKFRFYSHQWRTWAACFIQAAWRRFKRRRVSLELKASECVMPIMSPDPTLDYKTRYVVVQHKYAKKAAASTRIGGGMPYVPDSDDVSPLQKPAEPDFS